MRSVVEWSYLTVGMIVAVATALLPATPARAEDTAFVRTVLKAICRPGDIAGSSCRKVRGYPGNRSCSLDIGAESVRGRFIDGRAMIVVPYSGCEPHSANFGGSLVFEDGAGAPRFLGFVPGFVADRCVALPGRAVLDRLFCVTSYMQGGHASATLREVWLDRARGGAIVTRDAVKVEASDETGAKGAPIVDCKADAAYFDLSDPRIGPGPDTIEVTARYADAAVIARACAPGAAQPAEVYGEPPPGSHFVVETDVREGRFVYDLAAGTFVSREHHRSSQTPTPAPTASAPATVASPAAVTAPAAFVGTWGKPLPGKSFCVTPVGPLPDDEHLIRVAPTRVEAFEEICTFERFAPESGAAGVFAVATRCEYGEGVAPNRHTASWELQEIGGLPVLIRTDLKTARPSVLQRCR